MKEIFVFLLFVLCLLDVKSFGQVYGNQLMVVSTSGLSVRESASVNTKSVGNIKFGEMVVDLNEPRVSDEVKGMKGNWIKVKYASITGYVFDAFLGHLKKNNPDFPENYPLLLDLDSHCGREKYFNPTFHWYGVFESEENYQISLVRVKFSVSKENYRDFEYDQYLKIDVNTSRKPMFLMGFADSIPDYNITKNDVARAQSELTRNFQRFHVYPGQQVRVGGEFPGDISYFLTASGIVRDVDVGYDHSLGVTRIEQYKIKLVSVRKGVIGAKDVLEDVEREHLMDGDMLPWIVFSGDLNHDNVPDLILAYLTGNASSNTYVFMSGYNAKELLTKVALIRWGGCY